MAKFSLSFLKRVSNQLEKENRLVDFPSFSRRGLRGG